MSYTDIFYAMWQCLDIAFTFAETIIGNVFNALPYEALPFLIAIICYSFSAYLSYAVKKSDGRKAYLYKLFNTVFLVLVVLFTLWRLGFTMQMVPDDMLANMVTMIINIVYIMAGAVLFYAFYKDNRWIKKIFLILSWTFLIIITFALAPALTDYMPDDAALTQILLAAIIFAAPNALLYIQSSKQKGVDL
jgi:hypothetical protein